MCAVHVECLKTHVYASFAENDPLTEFKVQSDTIHVC